MKKIVIPLIVFLFIIFAISIYSFFISTKPHFFILNFYEFVCLVLGIFNILLLIFLYNYFIKKLNKIQKKNDFIFKYFDETILQLQKEELKSINNDDNYRVHLLTQRKITNSLERLKIVCNNDFSDEEINKKILKIIHVFNNYLESSSEHVNNYDEFNKQKNNYAKAFQKIEEDIIDIQLKILNL